MIHSYASSKLHSEQTNCFFKAQTACISLIKKKKMEFSSKWDVNMVMNELIQGMDQAIQLKLHLGSSSASSFQVQDLLLQRVISSFENALLMLQLTGLATQSLPEVPPDSGVVESSVSMNNGGTTPTPSDNSKQVFMDNQRSSSKKRKTMQTWTEQVKVSAEHGLEGPADDGYSWRKYGQKDILGAKFPRSYYRCTYRSLRNCCATKQVQRSDEHPTVFDITYKGFHTCSQSPAAAAAAATTTNPPLPSPPENMDQPKQTNVNINHQITGLLMNFQTNTMESNYSNKVADFSFSCPTWAVGENQFEQISTLTDECLLGKNSASLPESNYHSASSSWNDNLQTETTFLQQYESELTDIISSDASATSLRFSVDTADLDPKFFCDISDFLS